MLRAQLKIEPARAAQPEELRAEGTLVNASPDPIEIDPVPLSSPSLALEIENANGQAVLLPPPPVPGAHAPTVRLDPGDEHHVSFEGFVPGWLEPGRYRARLHYRSGSQPPVHSEWAEFEFG